MDLPELVYIPDGMFIMGDNSHLEDENLTQSTNAPCHPLYLAGYYLAKYPVTNSQYYDFVSATGANSPRHWKEGKPTDGVAEHPVVSVSWYDAKQYCDWLSKSSHIEYRLPSEAEWEKAARGVYGYIYPWGDLEPKDLSKHYNVRESNIGSTTNVRYYHYNQSPYGINDLVGNTREWTVSIWGDNDGHPTYQYPYRFEDGREQLDASKYEWRVVRGGSFMLPQKRCNGVNRDRFPPNRSAPDISFRVASDLADEPLVEVV